MHGMENVKYFCFILCPSVSVHQITTRQFKLATCLRYLNHIFNAASLRQLTCTLFLTSTCANPVVVTPV